MNRKISHTDINNLHRAIAAAHKGIKGYYRFDFSELNGSLRRGIETPVLMLESPSSQFSRNAIKTTNFKQRDISFLLLDFAGQVDAYDKQEEVLSRLEEVADDIASLLDKFRKDKNHWLYGLFDVATYKLEKVGPIMDNMYGWNVLYSLSSHNPLCFEPDKWNLPEIPEIP